jgi:chemotaxis protein methyltransferase CheR
MPEDTRAEESKLSTADFNFICKFVYDSTGIVLNDSKREMVYRRLTRIVRERKLKSFSEYCRLLKTQPEKESSYFINAITTNLTSFFRENHHFEYLKNIEIPSLLNTAKHDKRLRFWSSACSTGEEPYSLAITLLESINSSHHDWDIKILATDIDSNVLTKAKNGVYDIDRIDDLPIENYQRYFHKGTGSNENKVKTEKKLQQLITFKQLNLMPDWPMNGPFDVIFCRNVIIYFDKATQEMLFSRYYDMLTPGGLLILGHSENLGSYQKYFENVGRTMFRKPIKTLS